jgi:endonuclease YncB( thermonuclease family)
MLRGQQHGGSGCGKDRFLRPSPAQPLAPTAGRESATAAAPSQKAEPWRHHGLALRRGGRLGRPGGDVYRLGRCASASEPTCVVDGDTLRYRGLKIRLADIDTPEIFSPECAAEKRLGLRARDRLIELINAGPVEMRRGGARDEDAYGRKLRVLERNGRSLGMVLVEEGLAHRWRGYKESWCS